MAVPRGSIFGALLLISIGGLFLWANVDPTVRAWPIIGRFWPILIIFWGLSKLLDYLVLRGTPEAARAARISGGDIVLLIFILLCGTAISRVTQRSFWEGIGVHVDDEEWVGWFENRYQFTQELEQQIKLPAVLNITNRGNVSVVTHAGDRLQATIRKTVYAPNEEEAGRRAKEIEVVLEPLGAAPGAGYAVRWKRTGKDSGPVRADIELRVPARLGARIETRRGDVRVNGLQGDVTVSLERGEAEISGIRGSVKVQVRRGSVRVDTVRGDVEIRGRGDEMSVRDIRGAAHIEGEFSGPIRAANVTGETRFVSRRTNFTAERIEGELELIRGDFNLRHAAGNVTLLARDKEIYLDDLVGAVRVENRTGIIRLRFPEPPRDPVEADSRNGDIELILAANSAFTLDARTTRGEIASDFTGPGLTLREEKGGARLTGNYGTGGTNIRLRTRYGTIRLRRATPAAPTPIR
ncbi:MAG: DUF4097 family beta strand repeat-containing protein [Terriglobia bacterium]